MRSSMSPILSIGLCPDVIKESPVSSLISAIVFSIMKTIHPDNPLFRVKISFTKVKKQRKQREWSQVTVNQPIVYLKPVSGFKVCLKLCHHLISFSLTNKQTKKDK